MNLFNAHRTGHLSVAILFLSGLASMGHLAWPEIARLAVIVVGIVVAYTRYRDKLDDPVYRRPATALLALTCAFALTQFDPDTSIAGRYEQSPHMWTAQFAYLLVSFVPLFSVLTGPNRPSLYPSAWTRVDRVVIGVLGGVALITMLSSLLITERLEGDSVSGLLRIFCYAFLWLGVTRLYGDESWKPEASGPGRFILDRWKGVLILSLGLFVPTLGFGAIRTAQVFYHFREGQDAYGNGKFVQARASYEEADRWNRTLRLASVRDAYLTDLAILNLREGRSDAEETIARIREDTLDPSESNGKVAEIYLRSERWDDAARLLEDVLKTMGKDVTLIHKLGTAYMKTGDASGFLDLAETYQYVPQVPAETFDEVVFIGNMHFYRETYGEAFTQYNRALEIQPGSSYANYKIGRALSAQKNCRGAIEAYEKALAIDPTFADAHYRIGACLESMDDTDGALNRYRSATDLLPNHLDAAIAVRRLNG